ncbi:MAG: transcriptional regulator [Idiomarina sp.]|nr:transcriptional regulator [Idiomarina sp.]
MTKSDAIEFAGSPSKLARFLGRPKSTVSSWPEQLPRGVQFELQVKSNGKLKAEATLMKSCSS